MTDNALYVALRKPNTLELLKQESKALRSSAAFRAFARMEHLAENADSEHVRMKATEWLAGLDGLAPVKRVDSRHRVTHAFVDYDYGEFQGYDYGDALDVTDCEPDEPDNKSEQDEDQAA